MFWVLTRNRRRRRLVSLSLGCFLCAAILAGISACRPSDPPPSTARHEARPISRSVSPDWPPLPTTGFVRGRAATQTDVNKGDAVFVAEDNGTIVGEPLSIDVPQYALHIDEKTKEQRRVIVVQAERARGMEMIGYVDLASKAHGVATRPEFTLLGTTIKSPE